MDRRVVEQFNHITKWLSDAEIKQLCSLLIVHDLDVDSKTSLTETLLKIKREVKIND
tara:strand:- start:332 stop:502 length:171 start_codon:yes stop_codon:yes gene_type:complete